MRNYVTTYDPFFDLFFHENKKNNLGAMMRTDILNKEDHYELLVDLPGVNKEDIKLTLKNGYLTISVEIKEDDNENNEYFLKERTYGHYYRNYYLGENILMKHITAKLESGILKVTVQKPDEEEVNKESSIEIQ